MTWPEAETIRGFTPGPWTAEALVFAATGEPSEKWQISARAIDGDLILVAHVAGGGEAKEPNARLIAAAPDLLAEIERLRTRVEELQAADRLAAEADLPLVIRRLRDYVFRQTGSYFLPEEADLVRDLNSLQAEPGDVPEEQELRDFEGLDR